MDAHRDSFISQFEQKRHDKNEKRDFKNMKMQWKERVSGLERQKKLFVFTSNRQSFLGLLRIIMRPQLIIINLH
jgi:hypothetical protein